MGFRGYKFKYKLIVLQSFQNDNDAASLYAKTFELIVFISSLKIGFIRFDEIDRVIGKTLSAYSDRRLEEVSPFDKLEPTLETIGQVFFQKFRDDLSLADISLERLEISESPVKTCIVTRTAAGQKLNVGDKKVKVSDLMVDNIISQAITNLVSDIEHNDLAKLPPEQADSLSAVNESGSAAVTAAIAGELREKENSRTAGEGLRAAAEGPGMIAYHESGEQGVLWYRLVLSLAVLAAVGTLFPLYLANIGAYPSGADIYGHLFKADLLYHSILKGDFFPLYTDLWYNGMQPFRYWAPLPYYVLAILQFFSGGDVFTAYLLFVAFSIVIGGVGWLLWGHSSNRMIFCTFLGLLWFFMPDNMRVFFVEGNLPRMMIAILLPYLFYFIWRFADRRKKGALIPIVIVMSMITLCHAMIAAMTGIAVFLFLLLYSVSQKRVTESFFTICALLLSFALCGIWLYPALKGGLMGMDASSTSEVMKALSTPFLISLNPVLRNQGMHELFYFGLSVLIISAGGLFLADRKSRTGFCTVVLIFLGTTTAMVPFLEKLPLNQLFWMTRFAPIAYAIFLLSLLEWKKCRRYAVIIIAMILVLDCIPSLDMQKYHSQTPETFAYTIEDAKEIVRQRISLLDSSAYGSYPSFGISAEEPQTPYTFGWAWQGASTAHNIVMVNTAMERGNYSYVFDRSLELGDDTVLIKKELVEKAKKTLGELKDAARSSGYSLSRETIYTYIFHRDTPDAFGETAEYTGLTIGNSANALTLEYPSFEEGFSNNLSDYTYEELLKYKEIYLSGFAYNDKDSAQKMLKKAAEAGVKIIIDMNRIPVDPLTSRMTFFGVTAQTISFDGHYPELMYQDRIYDALPFQEEFSTWNTVYLENADRVTGYSWFQNKRLPFVGTSEDGNIFFMGYNLLYHAAVANDDSVRSLVSDVLGIKPNTLPERKLVPLKITFGENKIEIDSPGGTVNTTLAYQDNFRSEQKITNHNNLLTVTEPKTVIQLKYPYLAEGSALSVLGLMGVVLLVRFVYRGKRQIK